MTDTRLKCKFCNWSTAKAYRTKDGKFRGIDAAQRRMLDHVELTHPAEFDQVQALLPDREEYDHGR